MLLESSIMLPESSIMLLENIYSTSSDDRNMFIVQATRYVPKAFRKLPETAPYDGNISEGCRNLCTKLDKYNIALLYNIFLFNLSKTKPIENLAT